MPRYSIPAGIGRIVRDSDGTVVPGAVVTIYLAGTTNLATIYGTYTGPSVGSVTTDADGKFLAFVESAEYPLVTMFKFVTTYGSVTVTDDYVR